MVDSRQKGARAETRAKAELIKLTGLNWQRVPGSGALAVQHGLKGDLYVPNEKNLYCVEVKHYAEDHVSSKLLTAKAPQFSQWWEQTVRQGIQVERKPLLIFRFDRSKTFVAFKDLPMCEGDYRYLYYSSDECFIALLEDWIKFEKPKFIL